MRGGGAVRRGPRRLDGGVAAEEGVRGKEKVWIGLGFGILYVTISASRACWAYNGWVVIEV